MTGKRDVITILGKQYMLSEGVRAVDLKNLDNEDRDVLLILAIEGRHTRYYFEKRIQMHVVKRLKSRGLIKAVRNGSNYAYDLTETGYFLVRNACV